VTAGLLITLSLLSTLLVTAAVVRPRYLHASGQTASALRSAADPDHQAMIELLGELISRSRQVLAIHQRGDRPFLELVLWLEDGSNFGVVDPGELAVIGHSELLQTISIWMLAEPDGEEDGDDEAVSAEVMSDICRPEFCDAWRDRPDVARRMLAGRVASMEAKLEETSQNSSTLLRISLTWASEWTDHPDEASVLLDVATRRAPGARRSQ
jgi:hypothetical protein